VDNVPEIIPQDMQAVVLGPNPYQRAGICSTLERAAIGVLCETADHHAVARLATLQEVDVIVLNNPLPGQGAADALRAMPTRRPIKLVALLGPHEQSHPLALLRSEVRGLVNADGMPNELIRAVRCVVDGGLYISPAFVETVIGALAGRPPDGHARPLLPSQEALTPREREILTQLALGLANADIASCLYISEKTVKFHVSNILSKSKFRSRAQLIVAMLGADTLDQSPAR